MDQLQSSEGNILSIERVKGTLIRYLRGFPATKNNNMQRILYKESLFIGYLWDANWRHILDIVGGEILVKFRSKQHLYMR